MLVSQNIEIHFQYSMTHWFQPIVCLKNNEVIGYEALLRDTSSLQISPVDIFENAYKKGYLNEFDLISIKAALQAFENKFNYIFINVFPSTLLVKNFLSWFDSNIHTQIPVVLEISESEPVTSWDELKSVTKELKLRGAKIAVDDMGVGYSFFQHWIELGPDFIKLDKYFSKNLSKSSRKQKVIRSLMELLSDTTEIIIEGVETKSDLDFAKFLGVPYAQGYLLGKPSPLNSIRKPVI